jgi:hypothetical protein
MKVYCADCAHHFYDRFLYEHECRKIDRIDCREDVFEGDAINKPHSTTIKTKIYYRPFHQNFNNNCEFFMNKNEKKEKQSTLKNLIKKIKKIL